MIIPKTVKGINKRIKLFRSMIYNHEKNIDTLHNRIVRAKEKQDKLKQKINHLENQTV